MEEGRIKIFYDSKGYGYILDTQGREVYFHYTSIQERHEELIHAGDVVCFDVLDTRTGLEASNVKFLGI